MQLRGFPYSENIYLQLMLGLFVSGPPDASRGGGRGPVASARAAKRPRPKKLTCAQKIDPRSKCFGLGHDCPKSKALTRGQNVCPDSIIFSSGQRVHGGALRARGTAAGGRRVAGVAHTIPFFRSCHTRLRIEPGFNPGPAWAVRRKRPPFKMSLCTRTTDQKRVPLLDDRTSVMAGS